MPCKVYGIIPLLILLLGTQNGRGGQETRRGVFLRTKRLQDGITATFSYFLNANIKKNSSKLIHAKIQQVINL